MMYCMMLQCVLWELLLLLKWSSKNLRKFMAFRVGGPHSGLRRHWLLPLPVYCYQYCYHYHYHYCNNNNHNNNNLVTPAARSWAVQYSQNYHTINLKIQHELLSILIRRRTEDTREMVFPFQHLAIALQRGNVVAFLATSDAVWYPVVVTVFAFLCLRLCAGGPKNKKN